MKPGPGLLLLALAALTLLAVYLLRPDALGLDDDFDYEAAFEQPDAPRAGRVLDIPEIAAKSRDDVARTLGEPLACEETLYAMRCDYARGRTQIVYIDGLADWITVRDFGGPTPLAPAALALLGLPQAPPSLIDPRQLRWQQLAGLADVQLVGGAEGLQYARIKAIHADPR